jgi:hypothetical protein
MSAWGADMSMIGGFDTKLWPPHFEWPPASGVRSAAPKKYFLL